MGFKKRRLLRKIGADRRRHIWVFSFFFFELFVFDCLVLFFYLLREREREREREKCLEAEKMKTLKCLRAFFWGFMGLLC